MRHAGEHSALDAEVIEEAEQVARRVPVAERFRCRLGLPVAALVTYDEPTEGRREYAPYLLRVNGLLQPGG